MSLCLRSRPDALPVPKVDSNENIWIAERDSYWHIASNWSLGRVPNHLDNVTFNGESCFKCSVMGDVDCGNVTIKNSKGNVILELGSHTTFTCKNMTVNDASLDTGGSNLNVESLNLSENSNFNGGTSRITITSSAIVSSSIMSFTAEEVLTPRNRFMGSEEVASLYRENFRRTFEIEHPAEPSTGQEDDWG